MLKIVRQTYAKHRSDGSYDGTSVCTCGWSNDAGSTTLTEHITYEITAAVGRFLDAHPAIKVDRGSVQSAKQKV